MNKYRIIMFFLPPAAVMAALTVFHLRAIPSDPLYSIIRGAGIVAYGTSFLAIITSAFPKEATRLSGSSFLRVHHIFAFCALALMLVHASATWAALGTASVFVPHLETFRGFLLFGGRVALPLFIFTAVTAKFGRSIRYWRKIHLLNYAAFILVTTHAIMIGTDFDSAAMRCLAYLLAAIVMAVPAIRRFRNPRRSQPPPKP